MIGCDRDTLDGRKKKLDFVWLRWDWSSPAKFSGVLIFWFYSCLFFLLSLSFLYFSFSLGYVFLLCYVRLYLFHLTSVHIVLCDRTMCVCVCVCVCENFRFWKFSYNFTQIVSLERWCLTLYNVRPLGYDGLVKHHRGLLRYKIDIFSI